jgi:hypothetical protein
MLLGALLGTHESEPIRTFSASSEQHAAHRCAREGHGYFVHLTLDKYQCADSTAGIEKEAKDARAYLAGLRK